MQVTHRRWSQNTPLVLFDGLVSHDCIKWYITLLGHPLSAQSGFCRRNLNDDCQGHGYNITIWIARYKETQQGNLGQNTTPVSSRLSLFQGKLSIPHPRLFLIVWVPWLCASCFCGPRACQLLPYLRMVFKAKRCSSCSVSFLLCSSFLLRPGGAALLVPLTLLHRTFRIITKVDRMSRFYLRERETSIFNFSWIWTLVVDALGRVEGVGFAQVGADAMGWGDEDQGP